MSFTTVEKKWYEAPAFPLIISLVSLCLSFYTFREQKAFQKISLLQGISLTYSWEFEGEGEMRENVIKWKLLNSGKGPAVVKEAVLQIGNEKLINIQPENEARKKLQLEVEKYFGIKGVNDFFSDTVHKGYLIPSNDDWELFKFRFSGNIEDERLEKAGNIVNIAVCHCSLDGRCFYDESNRVSKNKLIRDCQNIPRKNVEKLLQQG